MRVLFLNYEFFPLGGGGSTVTYYLAKNLVKLGNEVHLITSRYRDLKPYELVDGIHVHRIPVLRRKPDVCTMLEMLTYILSSILYSIRFVRKWRPDVVQSFFVMPSGPAAYVLKKLFKIPYVIYLGGSDVPGIDRDRYGIVYDIITPFVKLIWRGSYETVAASGGLIDFARRADSKAKFTMIPNGVDLERFKPKKKKKTDKVKILFIGRLIRRKGLHYLIEALPKVLEKANKDFIVEVVGTGPEKKNLDKLSRKLKVKDHMIYVGAIPYEKLHESYHGADVFVLPSTGEGMPCVVLEAMGCGLPIVASDVPGNEEIVVEGRNGFIFKPREPHELADALVKIINDGELRQKMSVESSKLSHKYSWASIAARYHRLYKSMVSK